MTIKRNTIPIFIAIIAAAGIMFLSKEPVQTRLVAAENSSGEHPTEKATQNSSSEKDHMEKATFAAGCFWGVEAAFRQVEGVKATTVGYTGGHTQNPTYRQVCAGNTGHAEAVQVTYDPTKVTYEDLLKVFWESHDPTQVNRQGPDLGEQYRSAIFYHTPEQEAAARASKKRLDESGKYTRPIATEITAATEFYVAEEYHQQYLEKRGLSTCRIK
jgi:peptide-methionine (S)-S-oxide reductase